MTDKPISEMTNAELDEALAVEKGIGAHPGCIMRGDIIKAGVPLRLLIATESLPEGGHLFVDWHPSTDIAQAMMCLKDAFNARLEGQVVGYLYERAVQAIDSVLFSDCMLWWLSEANQPRVLCEAVLKAMREEKERGK